MILLQALTVGFIGYAFGTGMAATCSVPLPFPWVMVTRAQEWLVKWARLPVASFFRRVGKWAAVCPDKRAYAYETINTG
jgi:hypothetical protein